MSMEAGGILEFGSNVVVVCEEYPSEEDHRWAGKEQAGKRTVVEPSAVIVGMRWKVWDVSGENSW